jgi:hypothetical protein
MWALVRVIGRSPKTKVQEASGFGRLHEVMRGTYYFSAFPETSIQDVWTFNLEIG